MAIKIIKRSLWLILLWWCATSVVFAQDKTVVDLDSVFSLNLLYESRYLLDEGAGLNMDTALNASGWQVLKGGQLRFGMEKNPLWLDISFRTAGSSSKEAVLAFNRVIDFVDVRLFRDHLRLGDWQQGAFLSRPAGVTGTNKNVFVLPLQPDHGYRLLIRVQGNNAITGSVRLLDKNTYLSKDETTLFLFIACAVMIVAIAFYNTAIYLSSGVKAFLYHAIYGVGILLMQASQYGYLDVLLQQRGEAYGKEILIVFSSCAAYSAVLGLFYSVVPHKEHLVFYRGLQVILLGNILITLLAPFIDFHTSLILFALNVWLGLLLGVAHASYLACKKDSRFWMLVFMLLVFAPSSSLLLLNRFGLIDDSFWAEYWILISVMGEMLLLSGVLFARIHRMRMMFRRARYHDPRNNLPNIIALQEHLQRVEDARLAHALSYCWIAGLEKMEIARGAEFRNQYLIRLAGALEVQLQQESFALKPVRRKQCVASIFYCENNTLGLLTQPLDSDEQSRLQQLLNQQFDLLKLQSGYNLGVSPVLASNNATLSGGGTELVIHNTNVALSQCIRSGKNLLLYNDDVGYNERRQIILLQDFEAALAQNQFYLQWQPQLDPASQRLSGLEALVRWRHPVYGELAPARFIPLLEQNSMITGLSLWVMQQVLRLAPTFLERFPQLDISFNLSVYDLMCPRLLVALDEMLLNTPDGVASRIIIEVTESVQMEDNVRVRQTMEALQERGFRISIDDFGAGYASFGYLQTLPVNELKIDKRYTNTCHEANSQAIIHSIIELGKCLNIRIVAEGIEDQLQQELFTGWGVHRLQGWRVGKPAMQDEILASF
ncbi:MAG: EAL domain-containing protein [Thiolinea sp.]